MARSPVVISSTELDAHLHDRAAKFIKSRHSKHQKEVPDDTLSLPDSPPAFVLEDGGNHGDDLMTPPEELLEMTLLEAERCTQGEDVESAVGQWVKAAALSRIVYGDSHWELARCHVLLGKAYLELQDLREQALGHAVKGRDILLSPGGHVTSHDPPPEAVHCLAQAHCLVGRVLTSQGKLGEAERSLVRAEQTSERHSKLLRGNPDVQLDLEIASAMGRLCLMQEKREIGRDCLRKAVELSKAAYGARNHVLVPLLKELASAEQQNGDIAKAVEILREALEIAEESHGTDSVQVADLLVRLARAHVMQSQEARDRGGDTGPVEELLQRAFSVYCSKLGDCHEESISCREELCRVLISGPTTQEKAIQMLKEIIGAKKRAYGSSSREVAHSYKLLGSVYLSQGRVEQAKKCLGKARDGYCSSLGAKHKETMAMTRSLEIISGSATATSPTGSSKDRPRFQTVV